MSWCGAGEMASVPFGDHTRAGNVADDLCARQMPADAGLCALPHFDLDRGPALR
jgi:hypothetical protein